MTDDLKTKMSEAIFEAMRVRMASPGSVTVPFPDRAAQAALQAIHDAGFAVVPRSALMAAIKLSQDGRRTASLPAIGHILTDALIVASQPKTEGGET